MLRNWIGALLLFAAGSHAVGTWETIFSFPAPSRQTNGLTFDGRYLWHSYNVSPGYIYKIEPLTGDVIKTITTNIPDPGDLEWHRGFLYVVEENQYKIYKINPDDGATVDIIPITVHKEGQMEGIASDGRYLWVDLNGEYLVQIDPETHENFYSYQKSWTGYADGLSFAWGSLFVVTNAPSIVEMDACSGARLQEFAAPAGADVGPEGLTWDGEFLWYADNTTDRIYKIRLIDDYLTKPRSRAKRQITCSGIPSEASGRVEPAGLLTARLGMNPVAPGSAVQVSFTGSGSPAGTIPASLYNIDGKRISSVTGTPGYSRTVVFPGLLPEGLAGGLYLVRLNDGRRTHTLKLIATE